MMKPARIFALLLAALYAVAAGLQFNDPDTGPWLAVYASAALFALLHAVPPSKWPTPAARRGGACAVSIAALLWAATLAAPALRDGLSVNHELSRELGGLLIVAAGLLALAASAPNR